MIHDTCIYHLKRTLLKMLDNFSKDAILPYIRFDE
jgi:hypothetical protein